MLWSIIDKKVLLANLGDSSMKNEERGDLTIVKDYYRIKTYTKPEDMLVPARERDFSEPYMIAQSQLGGTWNEYNSPFMIQVAGCNMKCPYCFVPDDLKQADETKGKYFTAEEIIKMHDENEPGRKLLRISGGEPFLVPEFLIELAGALHDRTDVFLWIDTNFAGTGYAKVIDALSKHSIHFGICGCFKGYDAETFSLYSSCPEKMWETQWKNAKIVYDTLLANWMTNRLFLYVPELIFAPYDKRILYYLVAFKERLQKEIHENAPLRVTILSLKDYDANKGWRDSMRASLDDNWVAIDHGETRRAWNDLLLASYPREMVWLPQYQAPIDSSTRF